MLYLFAPATPAWEQTSGLRASYCPIEGTDALLSNIPPSV
jgi:hypothetical protein